MAIPVQSDLSKLGFSGHETFPFRYGWLRKAAIGAEVSPTYFSQPLALVLLGVGKNMVQSIRHWGTATGMLVDLGRGAVKPSDIGQRLLSEWDPYLEEAGSLWLVHWLLVNNPAKAAAWHYAFFHYPRRDFTKAEMVEHLSDWAARHDARNKLSTIERDVDCLLRTYLPGKSSKKGVAEESFDCPLAELRLLQTLEDGERFGFVFGAKRSLPDAIFAYALLDFLERVQGERQTVVLHEALYEPGSPGQAFKLSENSLIEGVEAVEALTRGAVQMDDTAGLKQIYLRRSVDKMALLDAFYAGQV
ncbi:DUF4007 family protein [Deinococcus planocerae]|uniref:DUF4007 family protein n=1 Tax=Deinococcus planocerae TaxID=1737569 RepID=UPI001C63EAB0|nr:DUF4007 family protein [Deinococcus planocerae]